MVTAMQRLFLRVRAVVARVLPERWHYASPEAVDRVFLAAVIGCVAILFLAGAEWQWFLALGAVGFIVALWLG
jgi:hypothetical protein